MTPRPVCLASWILFLMVGAAQAQWAPLASKVPSASNAVVLMDVDRLMASPIAQREGWQKKYNKSFAAGLVTVPPTTKRALLAAQIDFETWRPLFELAALELNRDASILALARQTKGTPDLVAGLQAVVLPEDAYLVEFDSRHLIRMAPANRQAVVRWLREVSQRDQPKLSTYLERALELTGKIDLVEALDMEDAIPAEVIRAKLDTSQVVSSAKPPLDVEKLVALLSTLKGVTFEIVLKDDIHARFLIDFGQDAGSLASLGKPLLLESLRRHGVAIDDFDGWAPSTKGPQFVLTGKLTPSGMRKVFSLIDAPIADFLSPSEAAANADPSSRMAANSLSYFKSVQSVLDDVRKESRDSVTLGQNAAWLDRWARRIERLPILDVDSDMLDYGMRVVAQLRAASDALKGAGINTARRNAYYGRDMAAGGYFGYDTLANKNAVQTEERTQGAATALSNCRTIDSATATIRRIMTERYKIEF